MGRPGPPPQQPCSPADNRAVAICFNRLMNRMPFLLLGWTCIALGTLGVFLPLLPTTVFLLIAAWAFAKGSPRWHAWLLGHPLFGRMLHCWQRHRAMPRRAKTMALATLAGSYAFTAWVLGPLSLGAILAGLCIAGVALYLAHIPVLSPAQEAELRSGSPG